MCWSALTDLLRLDEEKLISVPRKRFEEERQAIRTAVLTQAYDSRRNTFVGAFGETFLDATLLLLPRIGFMSPTDARMQGTLSAIDAELRKGHLVRRYSDNTDNFSGQEGAFVICGFWAVDCLARCGRLKEAKESMEALLGYTNDLGLLSEEVDVADGSLLGNFPQGFSHTGLVNAALAIAEAERTNKKL